MVNDPLSLVLMDCSSNEDIFLMGFSVVFFKIQLLLDIFLTQWKQLFYLISILLESWKQLIA